MGRDRGIGCEPVSMRNAGPRSGGNPGGGPHREGDVANQELSAVRKGVAHLA
jgi:hypothetical protein